MFGMCTIPSTVSKRAAMKRARAAGRRSGRCPGPEVERVEAPLREPPGRRDQRVGARRARRRRGPPRPGGRRARARRQLGERLVGVEVRVTSSAQAGSGRADRPVGRAVVDDLAGLASDGSWSRPARSGSMSSSSPGSVGPLERDPRAALLAEREHPLAVPRGDEVERLRARVLEPRALDVEVEVEASTNFAPCAVGARGDRARTSCSLPISPPIATIWPGWTLAPKPTSEVGEALQCRGVEAARVRHRKHTTQHPPSSRRRNVAGRQATEVQMSFLDRFTAKLSIPDAADALPGRDTSPARAVAPQVLGTTIRAAVPRRDPRPPSSGSAVSGAPSGSSGRRHGVCSTAVGYAGGARRTRPTRRSAAGAPATPRPCWSSSTPRRSRYDELLQVFWEDHDPTQGMRQGNDVGTQYRSAIYRPREEQLPARRGVTRALPGRAERRRLRRDHHGDRDARRLLLRRGLPPAVPAQGAERLLRPRRHGRQLPDRRGRQRRRRRQPVGVSSPERIREAMSPDSAR